MIIYPLQMSDALEHSIKEMRKKAAEGADDMRRSEVEDICQRCREEIIACVDLIKNDDQDSVRALSIKCAIDVRNLEFSKRMEILKTCRIILKHLIRKEFGVLLEADGDIEDV
jgi:hypothetical protein